MKQVCLAVLLLVVNAAAASAQGAVFLVRHAERADSGSAATKMATDPDLSDAGRARATSLAAMLRDAGIKAIFTTEYKRTQQTAAPLATALGITPVVVPARDLQALVEKLKGSEVNALVVGHSNTVGEVIAALGVTESVKISDAEYDNLFIVLPGARPSMLRLHYDP